MLASAEHFIERNDLHGLASFADGASESPDMDLDAIVDLAILLRERGIFDKSDRLARTALEREPGHARAWLHLGIAQMLQGFPWDGLISAQTSLLHAPRDTEALALTAKLAIMVGERARAEEAISRLAAVDPDHEEIGALTDFLEFYARYPSQRAMFLCRQKELSDRFLDSDDIVRLLRAALAAGEGFSLVRNGDGEGAFAHLSEEDEARFARLYAYVRRDRAHVWFRGEVDLEASGFNAIARKLKEVVSRADVVGIPYASWVAHEYNIGSLIGMTGLTNMLRLCKQPGVDVGQRYCRQDVHADLNQSGRLAELLSGVGSIGLIGCHPGLPDYVKSAFELRDVEFYKIPGEKLFEDIIGAEAARGVHFPDRYLEVMAALERRDLSGRLFLVAGGILGKFYCDQIKRSCGVALDVGSVVDAWLKLPTR